MQCEATSRKHYNTANLKLTWSFKFSLFASNLLGIVCWIIYLAETDVKICTMMMIVLMMSNRYNTQRSQTQSK